jgi:HAD superfamily hydrolase (TIGR01509 family)
VTSRLLPRVVTLDYWDTLYDGATLAERIAMRMDAVGRLLAHYGLRPSRDELESIYREAGREFERWWHEHRGYTTDERLRWTLRRAGAEPKERCDVIDATVRAVDEALLAFPPPLLAGAAEAVRRLAERFQLAIISDTGFASGKGQDALLAHDGLLGHFRVRIYSCDVGHAKPHPEPFRQALAALGAEPAETLHVGDIERTDVAGALGVGMRAVRLDVVREGGASQAERVARSFEELLAHLDA